MKPNMKSAEQHRSYAESEGMIPIAVVTVSDSRTAENDTNYFYLREAITAAGHELVGYAIVKDEPDQVDATLERFAASEARMILFNGGTGLSKRDRTYDVLSRKLEKTLPGFGEIFRMLSYDQVGSAAMLSRATAGVYKDTVIISTPGSPAAVQLAWEQLIEPEIQHLAWELVR